MSSRSMFRFATFASALLVSLFPPYCLGLSSLGAPSRRTFLTGGTAAIPVIFAGTASSFLRTADPARAAAPEIFQTPNGIKYATLKKPKSASGSPRKGDIVAIEYTGYFTNGKIWDSTHAEGQRNALTFELGGNVVIPGINEMLLEMSVGQKVQAIIPPELAFGDKGLCLDDGECLIQPKTTLVYDIYLKKDAIPPP